MRLDGMARRRRPAAAAGGGSGRRAGRIRTDRIVHAASAPRRGEMRVLATRFWPRGHRRREFDVWLKELAPSAGLLLAYRGRTIEWAAFARRYTRQIAADGAAVRSMLGLRNIAASGRPVVLYCHEREGEPCHRHVLAASIAAGDPLAGEGCREFFDAVRQVGKAAGERRGGGGGGGGD